MKGRVVFEFELDGNPSRRVVQEHVAAAAAIMRDRLIGEGFTMNDDGLLSYSFESEVSDDPIPEDRRTEI